MAGRRAQQGAALIVLLTVLVLGLAWYTVGALGKLPRSDADRDIATGVALQTAKRALLDYLTAQAARSDNAIPGRMPCPEPLSPSASSEGIAAGCSDNAATYIGRLPWRTLGVDKIYDGHGELLWYILGPGFRQSPVNFGSAGQMTIDIPSLTPVVAMIVAPGAPLNTLSEPGTPACTPVNQLSGARYAKPFDAAKFLECERNVEPVAPALPSYVTTTTAPWTNDRMITITAAEVMDAIAGPVADRLQRTVAPILTAWDATEEAVRGKSWGTTWGYPYLPFASAFTDPAANDYCGNAGVREGLPPVALASAPCPTNWTGSASLVLGLANLGCSQTGTHLRCRFQRFFAAAPFSARISATAAGVAGSFRGTIVPSDMTASNGGSISLTSTSFSSASGNVSFVIDVSWPASLASLTVVEVHIPNLPDAVFLADTTHSSYTSTRWFFDNAWAQHTYYAVAPGATLSPASTCSGAGDPDCLTANGLPATTGNASDKRLILALMGPALATQTQPSNNPTQYLESHTVGTQVYTAGTVTKTFNDRIAACPFQHTPQSGGPLTICN